MFACQIVTALSDSHSPFSVVLHFLNYLQSYMSYSTECQKIKSLMQISCRGRYTLRFFIKSVGLLTLCDIIVQVYVKRVCLSDCLAACGVGWKPSRISPYRLYEPE